ncbi:hypothetical protein BOTBODRAFT_376472 [Botryobasidium botryosum FD-172 SS1]|uniref:Secreted peptide n=1 Tax=Botryobasidium botryosum (strain FD-172 SS1) TaxID=930990 RepID=A0A067N7L4_BOTB1|nr:hypothetical protein BOTBODRAFT_376472 [Botryobasidium botryosum FD-172 SS1]
MCAPPLLFCVAFLSTIWSCNSCRSIARVFVRRSEPSRIVRAKVLYLISLTNLCFPVFSCVFFTQMRGVHSPTRASYILEKLAAHLLSMLTYQN